MPLYLAALLHGHPALQTPEASEWVGKPALAPRDQVMPAACGHLGVGMISAATSGQMPGWAEGQGWIPFVPVTGRRCWAEPPCPAGKQKLLCSEQQGNSQITALLQRFLEHSPWAPPGARRHFPCSARACAPRAGLSPSDPALCQGTAVPRGTQQRQGTAL